MIMNYTLAQLDAFLRIVDIGTFHGAARHLKVTQPTISQRIRELEAAVGASLFVRELQRTRLTPDGVALVDPARRVLSEATELARRFRSSSSLKGELRLGMTDTFAIVCLDDLLRRLNERYPDLKTSVRVHDSGTTSKLLEDQELDTAIVVEAAANAKVRQVPAGRNELVWVASPRLRLPRLSRPRDLAHMHIMLPPPPSRVYGTITEWFADAGIVPTHLSTCNSVMVTLKTVVSGLAVSVQPTRLLDSAGGVGRLRRLRVTPEVPAHRVSICYQTKTLGPEIERVVALQREVIADHGLFIG